GLRATRARYTTPRRLAKRAGAFPRTSYCGDRRGRAKRHYRRQESAAVATGRRHATLSRTDDRARRRHGTAHLGIERQAAAGTAEHRRQELDAALNGGPRVRRIARPRPRPG